MRTKRRICRFSRIFRNNSWSASSTVIVPPETVVAFRASTSAGFFSIMVSATWFTNALNSSVFATKSVSEFTSTTQPTELSAFTFATTIPSAATRPAFFACVASPFSRSSSIAFSTSPSASVKAFLQSIIPTPVDFRSSLTSFAVKLAIGSSS